MFDAENMVVVILMVLLFLRQFAVFKHASKINYAPLILILGALGALLHLMMHPHEELLLLLREALLPLSVSLLLYLILNILNQTQHSNRVLQQEELQAQFLRDMDEIKQDIAILNEREYHLDDDTPVSTDIMTLQQIQKNQEVFMKTFESHMERYTKSIQSFEEFTKSKMPEFDTIIHRHIEILRITEQDHFNQIKELLEYYKNAHQAVNTNMNDMNKTLVSIKTMHTAVVNTMLEQAGLELQRLFSSYETRVSHLHSQSETLRMDMSENELLLERLKERSEALIGQISLLSKKMDTMVQTAQTLPNLDHSVEMLATQRHHMHEEVIAFKEEVTALKELVGISKKEHDQMLEDAIETLSDVLNDKIDQAITKLYEQYFALQNSNASTMKELASRSKIQKTYLSNSQE